MTLLDIRPAEDIPEFLRQTDNPRPMGQSTAEKWRLKTKDGTVIGVIITSWELTYRERPAELVLARREGSGKARAARGRDASTLNECASRTRSPAPHDSVNSVVTHQSDRL
jgi:hypothetical protein